MEPLFFVQCHVAPDMQEDLQALRPTHLDYIRDNENRIAFGGIASGTETPVEQIVYFLRAAELEDAEGFVRDDPYWPCYAKIFLTPFTQKIPRDYSTSRF